MTSTEPRPGVTAHPAPPEPVRTTCALPGSARPASVGPASVVPGSARPASVGPGSVGPGSDLPALDAPETRAARRGLRDQIAALQEELRTTLEAGWAPETLSAAAGGAAQGPRLLDLGELEAVRDDLLASLERVRAATARRAAGHARARALLEAMYADPDAHRGVRLTTDDLGLPGCCRWQVSPVLGVVGRLAGWWRVRVSSGCP